MVALRLSRPSWTAALSLQLAGCALDWGRGAQSSDAGALILDADDEDRQDGASDAPFTEPDAMVEDADSVSSQLSCTVDTCLHGGECKVRAEGNRCQCPSNYQGAFCESDVNECPNAACDSNYPCINTDGAFTCRGLFAGWPIPRRADADDGYVRHASGAVLDQKTGLMWEPNSAGASYDLTRAKEHCSSLRIGGFDDWRVPTFIELATMFATPVVPNLSTLFSDGASGPFWTSSPVPPTQSAPQAASALFFSFDMSSAKLELTEQTQPLRTRCVRTASVLSRVSPNDRWRASAGVVLDRSTGLSWQEAIVEADRSRVQAEADCAALSLGGLSWRLPTYLEYLSLYDVRSPDFLPPPVVPSNGVWRLDCYYVSNQLAGTLSNFEVFQGAAGFTFHNNCPVRCVHAD